LHSYVLNKKENFNTKMFAHFRDIVIFMLLGYLTLNHGLMMMMKDE